jgi:N-acetylmuramoyl-L-alanine amidase
MKLALFYRLSWLLPLVLSPLLTYGADVQGMRIYRSPDSTRLVFDLSSAAEHQVKVLPQTSDKPERILIELKNTVLKGDASQLKLQDTPIAQIRFGQHNDFDLWAVLDLKSSVTPKAFLLKPMGQYGDRLVVDLYDKEPVVEISQTPVPLKPPVSGSPALRDILIVIDPGHGGEDPGAIGPNKLREKDITLKISRELAALINAQPGYRAELTRNGDYFIPLGKRSAFALKKKADLFVSIHADAFTNKKAAGASVYAWSQRGSTSTTAQFLADKENLSDLVGGADPSSVDDTLSQVLADLSIDGVVNYSLGMGSDILREIGSMTKLHKRQVEQAGFMVLKSVRVPSLLIETGFISNHEEARKLSTPEHQAKIARAIFNGIHRYFSRVPPPNTYIAAQQAGKPVVYTPEPRPVYTPGPASTPTPKPVAKKSVVHTVKRGETLSGISAKYNVTITALKKHNQLKSSTVYVGQKIKIPQ